MASRKRTIIAVVGLLLLALFIWFAGPYLGFVIGASEFRPLESIVSRVMLIALVVAVFVASILWRQLRARRASDNLMAEVVNQSSHEKTQPSAETLQLRERFEEAVATLKKNRRGGHSLYDLPWYVIIGAPGTGKTTALVNSGLKFPVEQRSGRGALRGVGGTRNCDWWFTDEAIFLDTAGRYLTQDSDAAADSAGWAEFLALLCKYRKRRPVNGVILAVSAQDLILQNHYEREVQVAAARRRLDELIRELRIQLPVYVIVTKCDLVSGFTEYFDDLTQEGRAQVWGVTFPYDATVKGEAAAQCGPEFDELLTRLNARLLGRLEEERDGRRRVKAFGFPHQMGALRGALTEFVSDVFGSMKFDKQILLRGVYFTSGTQEGTPIDRLLGAMMRGLAGSPEAVATPGRGKAYFVERLLKDVLFAESGLAGLNWRLEMRKAFGQLSAYALMVLVAVLGVVVLTISFGRNRSYVQDVAAEVNRLAEVPAPERGASPEALLPRLDAVRTVVDTADRHRDDIPLAMRWGLYQGTSLGNAARDAYARELDGALLPEIANRIKARLRDYTPEPEKLYEYLKAYLMLGQPERLDKRQLAYIADLEWQAGNPDTAAALSAHFARLLEQEDKLRTLTLDEDLVTQARSSIRQASVPGLMYRYVRLTYANDSERALRLDLKAGLGSERVLRRRSGVPLSQPVSSLYTAPVFWEITGKTTEELARQYAADRWVWGEEGAPRENSTELRAKFLDFYEKDYISVWDALIKDIEPVAMRSLAETKEALAILTGPTSPLRGFLKTVDENTYLVKPDAAAPSAAAAGAAAAGAAVSSAAETKARSAADGIVTGLSGVFDGRKAALSVPRVQAGAQVTEHFADIHRLVAGEAGAAPIDLLINKLREIQQKIAAVGEGVGLQRPTSANVVADVGAVVKSVNTEATALPSTIASVVTQLTGKVATTLRGDLGGSLAARYEQDVVRQCREITRGRYPFVAASPDDVPLADFGRLFGDGGVYDSFFKSTLQELVDTARTPWVWRRDESGAQVGGGAVPLARFEAAERIRGMFFRGGSREPELRFRLESNEIDQKTRRFVLELEGQRLEDVHGPPRPAGMAWPGPTPGTAAVSFDGSPNRAFTGPWAWFRLLAFGDVQRLTDERYKLTFSLEDRQAILELDALTIRNPYGSRVLQQFSCE
jgi:type VI secretion system protein ImpL